jgi:hypothetical protein
MIMNNRERSLAILNYEDYDRMPVVHFGTWKETKEKWIAEGHFTKEEIEMDRGGMTPEPVMKRLGFDFGWAGNGLWLPNAGFIPGI